MSQQIWFDHFKEQLQGLTEAYKLSNSSGSLLGYALSEGRLSYDEYFSWAQSHFQLPRLQSRFFTETPPSPEMFAKWATHYRWSAECLPVAEWDGSLIIACLQPPQDFPKTQPFIAVLASHENLAETWVSYSPPKSKQSLNVSSPGQSFSFEDMGLENPLESVEDSSSLENIFDEATFVKLEAFSPPAPVKPEEEEEAPATESETVIFMSKPPPQAASRATGKALTPQPLPAPPSEVFEDSFSKDDVFAVPAPRVDTGITNATINPVSTGHFLLEKLKKKNGQLITEKVKTALTGMKAYFEKSMILTLDEEQTQLTAFAWDESFDKIKDVSQRIPLKKPSIFNIVVATQKPFHGYVSLNDENEKFFEVWNRSKIPDHITITPLVVQEKIVGLLVGFGEKSAYNKTTLKLSEKISNEFIQNLKAA